MNYLIKNIQIKIKKTIKVNEENGENHFADASKMVTLFVSERYEENQINCK